MSQWNQNLTLTEPAALGPLADGVDSLVTAADATMTAAAAALDAAKLFLSGTAAPQAAAAAALVSQAQGLIDDVFGAGFYHLAVHPWTPGVSRGDGVWRELSFPRCVAAMANSFDDRGDAGRPQFSAATPLEMIAVVVGGPSPAIFKAAAEALNALLDTRPFALAIRRIEQAFELEADRYSAPVTSKPPDWDNLTVREALPALAPLEDALNDLLATLRGYAAGAETSVAAAISLIAEKQARLTALQGKIAAGRALFGQGLAGAGTYTLHITGLAGAAGARDALRSATGAPSHELSFCGGVVWLAPDGALGPLAGVMGV
ncbi:MAG: hypothetical protein OEZ59_14115 [Deltaproteobacteria bacterium]|nr:hypothetical protein [Deltaproteobacteria bacterium]